MIKSNLYNLFLFITLSVLLFNSCKNNSLIFEDKFDSNINNWDTISSNQLNTKIENGHLLMSGQIKDVINLSLIPLYISDKNISLISSIQLDKFYGEEGLGGLILFADNQKFPENYLFFGVNFENEILISFESKNATIAQTFYKQKNKTYKNSEINNFSIITNNNSIQFLLNGKALTTINKNKELGDFFGFIVLNSQISVDDFNIKLQR